MIYRFSISTDEDTAEADKDQTILRIARGVIHQIDIIFPPGSQGYLHLQINRGLHQMWPTNPDGSFAVDNNMISFREHQEILWPPYRLEAYTWNLDDTYPHDVIIRIGILPRSVIMRRLF